MSTSEKKYKFRWTLAIIAMVGLIDSIYLAWLKIADATAACGNIGDCESVNSSPYAEVAGIPIALFGAGAYLLILISFYMEPRAEIWRENAPLIVFGISLAGVLYSAYLTYVEVAILHAVCPYCVLSAIVLVVLLVSSIKILIEKTDAPED